MLFLPLFFGDRTLEIVQIIVGRQQFKAVPNVLQPVSESGILVHHGKRDYHFPYIMQGRRHQKLNPVPFFKVEVFLYTVFVTVIQIIHQQSGIDGHFPGVFPVVWRPFVYSGCKGVDKRMQLVADLFDINGIQYGDSSHGAKRADHKLVFRIECYDFSRFAILCVDQLKDPDQSPLGIHQRDHQHGTRVITRDRIVFLGP